MTLANAADFSAWTLVLGHWTFYMLLSMRQPSHKSVIGIYVTLHALHDSNGNKTHPKMVLLGGAIRRAGELFGHLLVP